MKLNLSLDLAVVISIITVFLFANGNAYLGGYLHIFNIDPLVLNFSVQDKIYIGYLKGFHYLCYFILILLGYIVLRYFLLSLDVPSSFNRYLTKKLNTLHPKHKLSIHNSSFYEELDVSYKHDTFFGLIVFILLISTLLLLANSEKSAKAAAHKDIQTLDFEKVQLRNKKGTPTLFLVECGASLCAVMGKDKKVILEEPKNIIFPVRKEKAP